MPRLQSSLRISLGDEVNWTVVSCPNPGWAESVFGEPDEDRLWTAIERTVRLDEDDPVAAWAAHSARLVARRDGDHGPRLRRPALQRAPAPTSASG